MPDKLMFDVPVMTIPEAARVVGVSPRAIRKAIRGKRLRAFIIGGRSPLRSGAGLGYRIKRRDLQAWYFGEETVPVEDPETIEPLPRPPKVRPPEPFYMPPDGYPKGHDDV